MSDPHEKRMLREAMKEKADRERALEQARARVRQHLQRGIEDIPMYTILEDADDKEFYKLLMQRRKRMFDLAPATILGVPVTPPMLLSAANVIEEMLTFHMVRLIGHIRTVLLLFRETDLYFVAFNPSGDPSATWFTFSDTPIPSFLSQVALPYKCAYGDLTKVDIGYYCFTEIIGVLSLYNSANVNMQTNERMRVFSCTGVMFSETMRIGDAQQLVMRLLHLSERQKVPSFLDAKIHSWGVYCVYGIRHLSGESVLQSIDEAVVPGLYNQKKGKFEIWGLIGRRRCSDDEGFQNQRRVGVILVFRFNDYYVPHYLMLKQKGYRAPEEMRKPIFKTRKVRGVATSSAVEKDEVLCHELNQLSFNATSSQETMEASVASEDPQNSSEDEKISNGVTTILRSDLNTLCDQSWLNDAVITFLFDIFQGLVDDSILLVPPPLSRLITKPLVAPNICKDLKLSQRSLVLLAINDKQDSEDGDVGFHWTLLAIDIPKDGVPCFIHLDSLVGWDTNWQVATKLADHVRSEVPETANAQFVHGPMPSQPNSFDCGVYTLAAAEAVCEWYLAYRNGQTTSSDWIQWVVDRCEDTQKMEGMRLRYTEMIETYAKKDM